MNTRLVSGVFLVMSFGSLSAQLPSQFDLGSVQVGLSTQSWVPGIQDQGVFSDCWTFASATAMESSLLMRGYLPNDGTPPTISISSWHLSTANGAPESLVGPNYGGNGVAEWGGFEYQAMGYATRGAGSWAIPGVSPDSTTQITVMGGGPVLNSQNALNPFPEVLQDSSPDNIGNLIPPAAQNQAFLARSIIFYDQGYSNNQALPAPIHPGGDTYNFDQGAADPQVAVIKNAMIATGAVTTSMNANYNYFHYVSNGDDTYTVQYFNPGKNPDNTDHEVTIIGWDDNYTMTDPTTNTTTTGAWIVQNSWGKSHWTSSDDAYRNDGTFYVSYNDASIGRVGVTTFDMEPMGQYSSTVLQNELGPMSYAYNYDAGDNPLGMYASDATKAASLLTAESDSTLVAVGLASHVKDVSITLNIYTTWSDGPSGLLVTQEFSMSGIGYQLFDLAEGIDLLSGETLVMELIYSVAGAIPVVIGGSGLYDGFNGAAGLSYHWTGDAWSDFYGIHFASNTSGVDDIQGGTLFLKGVLAIPEPSILWLVLIGVVVVFAGRRHASAKERVC